MRCVTLALFVTACLGPAAWSETVILAPGYGELEYTPPAAGSYRLPPLGDAVDGNVRDSAGRATTLHQELDGKLVLMGFIYTHCPDVNGCPLASYVMKQVQAKLVEEPGLRDRVRLISLSFDPELIAEKTGNEKAAVLAETPELSDRVNLISLSFDPELDTPGAMRKYSHHFRRKDFDWRFLTTDSEADLEPILEGYGQFRQKFYDRNGKYSGSMSHILRVYLVDRDKRIRNIYSAGFLHADTVVNDLKTLEESAPRSGTSE